MSAFKYKTIILDNIEYKLVPVEEELTLTTDELAQKCKCSKETVYKAKKTMTEGVHFFKPNGGKILFDAIKAVDFLLNRKKGKPNESKQRECIQKKRQPISLSEFFS